MSDGWPAPPTSAPTHLPTVGPAGPLWRIWHPSTHVPSATAMRAFGPLGRFDPHPPGRPQVHPDAVVLYGSLGFDVSALEVFRPRQAPAVPVVDVCPSWRATLIAAPQDSRRFDLADPASVATVGAKVELGTAEVDDYAPMQRWARFFHAHGEVDGLRYRSCRAADRGGIAVALWRPEAVGHGLAQHLLIDDALWPYLLAALDAVGVAVNPVGACPRCRHR